MIDPEDLNDKLRPLTVDLAALDKDGNRLLNVVIYPETVTFKAAAGYTKEVRLNVPVKDDSDDSYERTYTAPETIVIKGTKDLINTTGSLTAKEVDITYVYEDSEIPLEYELPEGIYLVKGSEGYALKVKVTEKVEEDTEGTIEHGAG